VTVLEGAEDEELQCYLLQLVQALRFERSDKSRLSYFLVKRGNDHYLALNAVCDGIYQRLDWKWDLLRFLLVYNTAGCLDS